MNDDSNKLFVINTIHAVSFVVLWEMCSWTIGLFASHVYFHPSIFNFIELIVVILILGPIAVFMVIEVVKICRADVTTCIQESTVLTLLESFHLTATFAFFSLVATLLLFTSSSASELLLILLIVVLVILLLAVSSLFTIMIALRCWDQYNLGASWRLFVYGR